MAVVLVVGARSCGHASSRTEASSQTSEWRASVDALSPVMATVRTPSRLSCSRSGSSSSVSPLLEMRIATSLLETIPRSPWFGVRPMSLAAVAAGAHGLIVEVHPSPNQALSDGAQSLDFENFDLLMTDLRRLLDSMAKQLA